SIAAIVRESTGCGEGKVFQTPRWRRRIDEPRSWVELSPRSFRSTFDSSTDCVAQLRAKSILRRPLQSLLDFPAQQPEVDRLGQQPSGPEFGRFPLRRFIAVSRDHDHGQIALQRDAKTLFLCASSMVGE